MATTLLKVYTLKVFDALRKWHPRVELHVYVDDVDLFCARPRASEAADDLAGAAKLLLKVFDQALLLQVAFQKCVLLAASADAEVRLRKHLRHTGLTIQKWGKKLGIQFTLHKRRRTALMQQRARKAAVRAKRIRFLKGAAQPSARAKLAATSVQPVATYGGCYWGYATASIKQLRRMSLLAVASPSAFRSASIMFLLHAYGLRDPAILAHQQPIVAWASVVWNQRQSLTVLDRTLE